LYFDFSELHERKCEAPNFPGQPFSDYELWSPTDVSGNECLLGRHVVFVRRKPEAQCFNGDFHERITINTSCPCSRDDYTCDFCFQETAVEDPVCILSEECKNAGYDPAKASRPNPCKEFYNVTQGYRKVVGDSCVGGLNLLPQKMSCGETSTTSTTRSPDDHSTHKSSSGDGKSDSDGSNKVVIGVVIAIVVALVVLVLVVIAVLLALKYKEIIRNRFRSMFSGEQIGEESIVLDSEDLNTQGGL